MRRLAAILLALVALAGGCGRGRSETLTVFAASSLTGAFDRVARAYEAAHPEVTIRLSYAGSTALGRQIRDGAPADVFAAADPESLALVERRQDGEARTFARNRLAIAVAAGNPKGITGPADLARAGLIVVVCAPEVPCGRRTGEMLRRAGVTIRPASEEPSVRSALTKVEAGEADAAVVYDTDVRAAGRVEGVAIPASQNVTSAYPIVALRGRHVVAARSFVSYAMGPHTQRLLRAQGFLAP